MKQFLKKVNNAFIMTSRQHKFILLVFWLSIYRNILLFLGSKRAVSEYLNKNQKPELILTSKKIAIAKDIALAIHIVNKYVPWKNVCRHQSWQATYLLLQLKIPFEYYVGIDKDRTIIEAHSWVKVGTKFICGICNEKKYLILTN